MGSAYAKTMQEYEQRRVHRLNARENKCPWCLTSGYSPYCLHFTHRDAHYDRLTKLLSEHHSVGQAAGPGETEEAFNNYMERVIGKTFIILSIFNSIHP